MSGISLNTFVDRAKLSESGEMRTARGNDSELTNKGTIGQKIASFFTGIGEALGLVKDSATRSERQGRALSAFRDALAEQYTDGFANEVMRSEKGGNGLDQRGATLTGRAVLQTVSYAETLAAKIRGANDKITSGEHLDDTAKRLGVDTAGLTDGQRTDYARYFDEGKTASLERNLHHLKEGEVRNIAEEALLKALGQPGGLDRRLERAQPYLASINDTLKASLDANGFGRNAEGLAKNIEDFMRRALKGTMELPRGEGPQGFQKYNDEVRATLNDFLTHVSRHDGKNYQRFDAGTVTDIQNHFTAAMLDSLKA